MTYPSLGSKAQQKPRSVGFKIVILIIQYYIYLPSWEQKQVDEVFIKQNSELQAWILVPLQRLWLPNRIKTSLISVTTSCFRQFLLLQIFGLYNSNFVIELIALFEQAAAEGVAYEDDWPYSIHLLAHIYVDDMYDSFFSFSFLKPKILCLMMHPLVDVFHVFCFCFCCFNIG